MKISIIDMGTQSIKHYIFDVDTNTKKLLHYKRYSEANLGQSEVIEPEAFERNLKILDECLKINRDQKVSRLQVLGTEILRKAENAKDFTRAVEKATGSEVQIISQDLEAQYLYEGFINIIPDESYTFAAVNIGGGSTEVVVGNKHHLIDFQKLPFGVKFLKKSFQNGDDMNWNDVDLYLEKEIVLRQRAKNIFVTGVLDYISTVGHHLGFEFEQNDLSNHPIKFTLATYTHFLEVLRNTPIEDQKMLYPKDPGYADNFATGQSVYVAIARKLSSETIIPSDNDLTDGVIHQMS
jgi:exopolyphosphatase/guanosine-5'-triphosphate,3'-diphosphate pyrophosphatase